MVQPVTVEIPHQLGRAAARARVDAGIGRMGDVFPGGAAVDHRWDGDVLHFTVQAMGQSVAARLEVLDALVRATVDLPPFLALFAERIRAKLEKEAPKLLQ